MIALADLCLITIRNLMVGCGAPQLSIQYVWPGFGIIGIIQCSIVSGQISLHDDIASLIETFDLEYWSETTGNMSGAS